MTKLVREFYEKHPVITIILAVVLAINLIPLAVVGFKIAIPILLIVGIVAVVRAFGSDKLESGRASRHLTSR